MGHQSQFFVKQGATFAATLVDVNDAIDDFANAEAITATMAPEGGRGPRVPMVVTVIDAENIGLTISDEVTADMQPGLWEFEVTFEWADGSTDKSATGYFTMERAIDVSS